MSDVCISVPSIVNMHGVEQYLKIDLSEEEQKLFNYSANTLKEFIKAIEF
jgi:malate/lactate dehydrogenase